MCFWEDDIVQLRWPDFAGGANRPSLIDAQANYRAFGAVDERSVAHVRQPSTSEVLDPTWRRFEPSSDEVEARVAGTDYGDSYAIARTTYYYWREH